ncbi:MAG: HPr family phosphocarrier protein [Phycisphaerae bacterium]|nr:HPr family phosphocarrier protein [Phycisphaerae bacterium]
MSHVEREVVIVNKYGLHARPAMQFVELANKFACGIEVSKASLTVDAKSIMSVMRLAATKGTKLNVVADGDDAAEAIHALAELIEGGFGEMTPE